MDTPGHQVDSKHRAAIGTCAKLFFLLIGIGPWANQARGSVVWYINDYDGWAAAAGDVHTIDFETLPNGAPSIASVPITSSFNYGSQGVVFSGPVNTPFITGNSNGHNLTVDSSPTIDPNWIIAELIDPARAVATTSVSESTLSLYDPMGELLASEKVHAGGGVPVFIGAISDDPIARATAGRNSSGHVIFDFYFAPVPEPSSIVYALVCCGVLLFRTRSIKRAEYS